MKIRVVALTSLVATITLTVPATAQIRNPSQDFFEQGREQLEREIQVLQTEPLNLEEKLEKPPSEPLPEVSPSPTTPPSEKPNEVVVPSPQPNEVDNQEQRIQK
jgi:hypothetical protein